MAEGVGLAPPPTRQKATKDSRVSIKYALMVLSRKIKSAGLVFLFLTSPGRLSHRRAINKRKGYGNEEQ